MARSLQLRPLRVQRLSFPRPATLGILVGLAGGAGCGGISCPESFTEVNGACEVADSEGDRPGPQQPSIEPTDSPEPPGPVAELCDGVDNDGDDAIDEDWPELGEPCGEGGGVGECVSGQIVCGTGGKSVVCEGAVGPTDEVCDGADNDCDGLIDEGVLSVVQEAFDDQAAVTGVEGGFVLTRVIADQLRVETYDAEGRRTGHHDDIVNPSPQNPFLHSDAHGRRVLVGFGKDRFYVLEAHVDADLVPIIIDTQQLHEEWNQDIGFGIFAPPYHPRVSADPPRFIGFRNNGILGVSPFTEDDLDGLGTQPTEVQGLPPILPYFTVAGGLVAWERSANVRVGWLQNDGSMFLAIDIARGATPAIALGAGGPGVAFVHEGALHVSELLGVSLECIQGGFCNALVGSVADAPPRALGLALDEATGTWFLGAGDRMWVVGREDGEPVVTQSARSAIPNPDAARIDVVVSEGTAAFLQASEDDGSVLTFMGCL